MAGVLLEIYRSEGVPLREFDQVSDCDWNPPRVFDQAFDYDSFSFFF